LNAARGDTSITVGSYLGSSTYDGGGNLNLDVADVASTTIVSITVPNDGNQHSYMWYYAMFANQTIMPTIPVAPTINIASADGSVSIGSPNGFYNSVPNNSFGVTDSNIAVCGYIANCKVIVPDAEGVGTIQITFSAGQLPTGGDLGAYMVVSEIPLGVSTYLLDEGYH